MAVLCPKCRQPLEPSGEVDIDGRVLAVYQCDDCTRPWSFDGEVFQTALTFALNEDGKALDPETLEPLPESRPRPSNN